MKTYEGYSLLQHNTFGIDVKCNKFIEYDSINDLSKIRESLTEPFMCVGHGSNLLFTHDYEGTILHCTKKGIRRLDDNDGSTLRLAQDRRSSPQVNENENENENPQPSYIEVGGGEVWDDVVDWCVQHGYYGAENLSLIPGETGAAAVQNIGAYGVEAKDVIAFVDAYHLPTGKFRRFSNEECNYSYRSSIFKTDYKGQYAILSVTLKLNTIFTPVLEYAGLKEHFSNSPVVTARDIREAIINIRNSKLPDPKTTGNAGSFFKNPVVEQSVFNALLLKYPNMPHYDAENGVKIPAGWMIDQCGWKGKSIGNAGVYEKQALVLINKGNASGNEILTLCKTIQNDVKNRFGIVIEPEVNII